MSCPCVVAPGCMPKLHPVRRNTRVAAPPTVHPIPCRRRGTIEAKSLRRAEVRQPRRARPSSRGILCALGVRTMQLESFFTRGLGDSSYLVASGDEAVVIDPQRDAGRFLSVAESNGWRVRAVLETHVHNDYVSGAHEIR